jgi:hypothetical protein
MDDEYISGFELLLPQLVVLLILFGIVAALAAALLFLHRGNPRASSFTPILPHPSQPTSMLVFVALPVFLNLVSLAWRFNPTLPVVPINSPHGYHRYSRAPISIEYVKRDGRRHYTYPENAADLTARAARRVGSSRAEVRVEAVRELAWWTGVCPNYSQFTIPILVGALTDTDLKVRGAAAFGLGSLGGNGRAAIPGLRSAEGTSVRYFDYLLREAQYLIEHSATWPPEEVCEEVTVEELMEGAVQQGVAAVEAR